MEIIYFSTLLHDTWISYVNAELKQQSTQWRSSTLPKPKKIKQTLYTSRKIMATVFCDKKGVLLVDIIERGTTITAAIKKNFMTKQSVLNMPHL